MALESLADLLPQEETAKKSMCALLTTPSFVPLLTELLKENRSSLNLFVSWFAYNVIRVMPSDAMKPALAGFVERAPTMPASHVLSTAVTSYSIGFLMTGTDYNSAAIRTSLLKILLEAVDRG